MNKFQTLSELIDTYIDFKEEMRQYEIDSRDYNRYGYQTGKAAIEQKYGNIKERLDDFYYDLDARLCRLESK